MLADPVRPRIYTHGVDGVGTIDLDTLEYTNLASGSGVAAFRLSISADESTLLYTNLNGSPAQEFKIDLESLTALPAIPIPSNKSAVLEGLNNQAYVAGPSAVHQFDATTGELQNTFAPPASGNALNLALAMSNDRRTLFVSRQYTDGELSTYDISTPTPALIEHVTGSFSLPRPGPDGQYIYAVSDSFDGQSVEQLALPGLTSSKTFATDFFLGGLAVGLNGAPYVDRSSDTFTDDTVQIYDPVSLALTAEIDPNKFNPTMYAYGVSGGVTDSSGKYFLFTVAGYSSEVWVFTTDLTNLPPPPGNPTKDLLNVSTRGLVQSGENAMIGGSIVQGNVAKKVLVRGIGPSLPLTGALSNPVMDLYDSSGKLLASNDDWIFDRFNIIGSQHAPSSEQEAAILMTLQPGAYTAVVPDRNSQPGLALVEVYDLDSGHSFLGNISTRGKVQTANDVMIGGFIIGGAEPARVLVRALGPSLAPQGVALPLLDPVLELHDGSGNLITSNDNWRATQQADIRATDLPPTDDRVSAILTTLQPGSYTAVVHGQGNSTGVALVEVYNLDGASASSN